MKSYLLLIAFLFVTAISFAQTPITGTTVACVGTHTFLSNATSGGSWSSSNTTIASVSASGVIYGIATGTVSITYTTTGVPATTTVTVNPSVGAIKGYYTTICPSSTLTLSNAVTGGIWSSSNTSVATIGASSGTLNTITGGTTYVSYSIGTCAISQQMNVEYTRTIIGCDNVGVGDTLTLDPGDSYPFFYGILTTYDFSILTQEDWNGNRFIGASPGTAVVTYASWSTGCILGTRTITVTPTTLIKPITGIKDICEGSSATVSDPIPGGTWTSSNTAILTINSSGTITALAGYFALISYTLPAGQMCNASVPTTPLPQPISGSKSVCVGDTIILNSKSLEEPTHTDVWIPSSTGYWTLTDTTKAKLLPARIDHTIIKGITAGTTILTFTGLYHGQCSTTTTITVLDKPVIPAITGPTGVCAGSTAMLSNALTGGTWSSTNTALATVNTLTGVVTGIFPGTDTILYSASNSCGTSVRSVIFTVDTVLTVPPIMGPSSFCDGATVTYTNAMPGGSWASSIHSVVVIFSSGMATAPASGTSIITYTATNACGASYATKAVTVNPIPSTIFGPYNFCTGTPATLSDLSLGGSWSSSNTAIADVGPATGIVYPVSPGTAVISYAFPTGCNTGRVITVWPAPSAITGASVTCVGSSVALSNSGSGGIWQSSNTGVATIGSFTGIFSGVSVGTATITYQSSTGCFTTTTIAIAPAPAAISGSTNTCIGSAVTLTHTTAGGLWISANSSIAVIGSSTGIVGPLVAGTTTITYTTPFGCTTTKTVTVNPLPAISGTLTACSGTTTTLISSITVGTWSSGNISVAGIGSASGIVAGITNGTSMITYKLTTGCEATVAVTINPAPAPVTGSANVCESATTTVSDATTGGVWSSSNTSVAGIDGAGIIAATTAGTAAITYSLPTGCLTTTAITVDPIPSPISGIATLCESASAVLSSSTLGGAWTSSDASVAAIGSASAIVTALAYGTAMITYRLGTGCYATVTITIDPTPAPINGSTNVCESATTTLTDVSTGGTWTSSSTSIAGIDAGGIVIAAAAGTAAITYTLPTGCYTTSAINVDPVPSAISGLATLCEGAAAVLSSSTLGGTWTSSDVAICTIGSGTGAVAGVASGITTITYMLATGCETIGAITIDPLPGTITGAAHICLTGSVTLSCAGTGAWSSADPAITIASSTGAVTGIATGTAAVTYTLPTGCFTTTAIAVDSLHIPSVSMLTSGDTVCIGSAIQLLAAPANEGTTPHYKWSVNGTYVGTDTTAYDYIPADGDIVLVALKSDAACALPDTATTSMLITVVPPSTPLLSISAAPGTYIAPGQSDTLVAVAIGAGPAPAYQWFINTTLVPGATSYIFVCDSFKNNDSVSCIVTNAGYCINEVAGSAIIHVGTLDTKHISLNSSISLYPNPNKGIFILKGTIDPAINENATVEITDMLGKVVYSDAARVSNGHIYYQVALANVANRVYMLSLRSGNVSTVLRFTVNK